MDIAERILQLYNKDTSEAFNNLKVLEALSDEGPEVAAHLDELLAMVSAELYVIRVRGFHLVCKQARWDAAGKIDAAIDTLLAAVQDEKPTAVRQKLQYLEYLVPHKPSLCPAIEACAKSIDLARFKDTMAPLIGKDIDSLLACIRRQ